ncbi:hypothetical protein VPH35_033238 [Triticum aestivum]
MIFLFAALIFFLLLRNHFSFLLELYQFFVGTMCAFCWNHINVFRWNHSIFAATTLLFAGTILIICWNHVFCFQAGVALFFLLQPTSSDADGERRALGNQRSFQVGRA